MAIGYGGWFEVWGLIWLGKTSEVVVACYGYGSLTNECPRYSNVASLLILGENQEVSDS